MNINNATFLVSLRHTGYKLLVSYKRVGLERGPTIPDFARWFLALYLHRNLETMKKQNKIGKIGTKTLTLNRVRLLGISVIFHQGYPRIT